MSPAIQTPVHRGGERKPKTMFQLDSPFTTVQWPQITPQNQVTILELLCSLLSPIGQHRERNTTSSKGKRSRKRKRKEAKLGKGVEAVTSGNPPLAPEISDFVAIGLNSVTRSLEHLSKSSKPIKLSGAETADQGTSTSEVSLDVVDSLKSSNDPGIDGRISTHFSAIFLSRSSQTSILNAHLPQLLVRASLAHPHLPPTRLVQLSTGSEERLCQALGIPRVSFLGLKEGAPFSNSLVDLIRECVAPVEIPWLMGVKDAKYLPVKINTIQTFASAVSKNS